MADNLKFDYFYGSQAEQFSFFRLPKVLVRDERFKKISSDAKILYGIMLDRMSLSRENRWIDKDNRVYIIFTLKEVMKEFECCQRKAGALMAELDSKSGIGLIEKKRQGLGKPDLIYLKNFIVQHEYSRLAEDEKQIESEGEVLPFQSGKDMPLKSSTEILLQTGKKVPSQSGTKKQFQNGTDMHLQSGKKMQNQSGIEMQPQSGIELPANYTEYNNTDFSDTDSINPINLRNKEDEMDVLELYRRIVKENIHNDDTGSSFNGHITANWYEYTLTVLDRFGNPDDDFPTIPGIKSKSQFKAGAVVAVALPYGDLTPSIIGEVSL